MSKLRKVTGFAQENRTAIIYWDSEWQEYRVKFYLDGKHLPDADYHTDDKEDAVDTAKAQTFLNGEKSHNVH